jgi:predicted nucleic acid-binding protein
VIVVADSSPLIALNAIEQVQLLHQLFQQIVVPPEVSSELASYKRTEAVRAFIGTPPPWLQVRSPSSVAPIAALHAGEVAAIALACELRADLLIMDERQGRKEATARKLRVIGTIGLLEASAERGLLDLEKAFNRLKQTDFWVSPKFLDERLVLFHERLSAREQRQSPGP